MRICCRFRVEYSPGHRGYCRDCYNAYKREYYQRHRDKEIARSARYNKANPEKHVAGQVRYQETDSYRRTREAWLAANRSRVRDYNKIKHYRRKKARGTDAVTLQQWRRIKTQSKNRCFYCGKLDSNLTMDHFIALSKGGRHIPSNIRPACLSCNSSKQDKDPLDYALYCGRLVW